MENVAVSATALGDRGAMRRRLEAEGLRFRAGKASPDACVEVYR